MTEQAAGAGVEAADALPRIDRDELISRIVARLQRSAPRLAYHTLRATLVPVEPAVFSLVVGAGFSDGSVPMVREMMRQTIGNYDAPGQDTSSVQRDPSAQESCSRDFWRDYNDAASRLGRAPVALDDTGLPTDVGEAYRALFAFDVANTLLRGSPRPATQRHPRSLVQKLAAQRRAADPARADAPAADTHADPGQQYVQGFLLHTLAPGVEHGDGLTGRAEPNPAHRELARLLAAQQTGALGGRLPFCRTIFTTNFDTLLQVALHRECIVPLVSDRPERGFDAELFAHEAAIHLVYTHGSVLRNNPASAAHELAGLTEGNVQVLAAELGRRDVIAIGHGAWADSLTAALRRCGASGHHLYWCSTDEAPAQAVIELQRARGGAMTWVALGKAEAGGGAAGLMRALNAALQLGPA